MSGELFEIARDKLIDVNEKIKGMPAPQVTVLFTGKKNFYVAVNDIDGLICEELKEKEDTKVVEMLTMWKDGTVDLSSIVFRRALVNMDKYNFDTDVVVLGREGYITKKLVLTLL